MQTFSNASSSEMLIQVRLTDGSMECFRPFDESQALQIWRAVDPIHLFAQPRLVIAGPNSKSVFVCAEINRITSQERWEENAGFSPSTLAPIIASLVCVAECGRERGESSLAEFVLEYAASLDGQREKSLTSAKGAHFLLFDLN